MDSTAPTRTSRLARLRQELEDRGEVLSWALALYLGWTLAWVLFTSAERVAPPLTDLRTATAVWLALKLLVWVLPMGLALKRRGSRALEFLGLDHLHGLGRGMLATLAFLVVIGAIDAQLPGHWPTRPDAVTSDLASTLVIAIVGPFLEEVLFRGYAFGALRAAGSSFWRANLESTVLFTLLHLPGWLFQGVSLGDCLGRGLNVALLGFLFGAVRMGGGSLWSSVIMHIVNNAWRAGWLLVMADLLLRRGR